MKFFNPLGMIRQDSGAGEKCAARIKTPNFPSMFRKKVLNLQKHNLLQTLTALKLPLEY